jgi:hypothetical protein
MPDPPVATASEQASLAQFEGLDTQELTEIARFWLSNPEARRILNDQLAEILRVTLERSARSEPLSFSFCPICSDALTKYEQPDIWVRGLRCGNGHEWAERGGKLGSEHFRLHSEPTGDVVGGLVSAWLGDNPFLRSNIHPSIRRVLETSIYTGGPP